jgi:hypothetical protein
MGVRIEWCLFLIKNNFDKLVFSGPDLTLSPTVLVYINVTRRIAEI